MRQLGRLDLAGNSILDLVFGTTSKIVERTGLMKLVGNQLQMCIVMADGMAIWVPMYVLKSYSHTQVNSASQWTITHNLNTNTPIAFACLSDNSKLVIASTQVLSANKVALNFARSYSGKAVIVAP